VVNSAIIVSSGIGGIINVIQTFEPNGFSDWSSLASLYDEFRVIGGEAKFFCLQQNSVLAQSGLVVAVYDNDDATSTLSSYNQALDYTNQIQFASVWDNDKFPTLRFTRPVNTPATSSPWASTGAPASYPCSIKILATGLSNSTNYFNVSFRMVLQLRSTT
jgi:hypothetical protein